MSGPEHFYFVIRDTPTGCIPPHRPAPPLSPLRFHYFMNPKAPLSNVAIMPSDCHFRLPLGMLHLLSLVTLTLRHSFVLIHGVKFTHVMRVIKLLAA